MSRGYPAALFATTLLSLVTASGCSTTTTSSCNGEAADAIASSDSGNASASSSSSSSSGSGLLQDGASCDLPSQCENNYCVPSHNSFGEGVCFSLQTEGCVVVTDPSPMKALCPMSNTLYTCGSSFDVTTLGMCTVVGQGDIGEDYNCCSN